MTDQFHPILRFTGGSQAGAMTVLLSDPITVDAAGASVPTADPTGVMRCERSATGWRALPLGKAVVLLDATPLPAEGVVLTAGWLVGGSGHAGPGPLPAEGVVLTAGACLTCGEMALEFDLVMSTDADTRLVVLEGHAAGAEFVITGERGIIGRAGCAAPIGDDAAAVEHARLSLDDGAWHLEPAEARCLTFLNGVRVKAAVRVKTGDRIRCGQSLLEFIDGRIDSLAGQSVDQWMLATRIGSGTMGVVFRARDAHGAAAAVKVLDPGLARDGGAVARFINAGRAQARVNHRHVLRTIAVTSTNGLPVVVMDWAAGGSLAERLASRGRIDVAAALALARDAVMGLQAGIQARQAHQGLRPSNLLLDGEGRWLVADLGLCAPYDPITPSVGADPRYCAPEEVAGSASDEISNQFSLGLVLHHCLGGTPPFGGRTREELARARIENSLPWLRQLAPATPAAVEHLVGRLLCHQREDRFPAWAAVLEAIAAAAAGREVAAPALGSSAMGARAAAGARALATPPSQRSGAPVARPRGTAVPQDEDSGTQALPLPIATRRASAVTSRSTSRRQRSLAAQLGIPPAAMSGLALVLGGLLAVILYSSIQRRAAERSGAEAAASATEADVAAATPSRRLALPAALPPQSSAPATVAASATADEVAPLDDAAPETPTPTSGPPPLHAKILVSTLVGGAGAQAITEVGSDASGRIYGKGRGFRIVYDPSTWTGEVQGDANTNDPSPWQPQPAVPAQPRTITIPGGATVRIGARTVRGVQQWPVVAGTTWTWWDMDPAKAEALGLTADCRAQDAWLVPGGMMVQAWAKAANAVITRDPREPSKPMAVERPSGPATLFCLVDPIDGTLRQARFIAAPLTLRAVDPWGRTYLPTSIGTGDGSLGMRGRAGVTVLSADLATVELNASLGALTAGEAGTEQLAAIALTRNLLILGGTTAAKKLPVRKAVQQFPGEGQDGFLVVIKLWE